MPGAALAGASRRTIPQLLWGAAFEHTLECGMPPRRADTYPEPRPGGYPVELRYGQSRDVVTLGTEFLLELELGPIPGTTLATGPFGAPVTGFDDANGWDDFLRWAADPWQVIRWVPDRTVPGTYRAARLHEPFRSDEAVRPAEFRFTRLVTLTLVSDDGMPFTGY